MSEVKIKLLPSQKEFLKHQDELEYAFCAGIGTGKSFATALWLLKRVLEHSESYLVASQTFSTTKTVQFKAITDALDSIGLSEGKNYKFNKSDLIMEFPNKAIIRGGSSQAPNAVTGATKYDGCWFDESAIFDNNARRYMMGRCRGLKEDGTLIVPKFRYTGSPPIDGHTGWYKDFLLAHPESCVFASMEEAVGKTLSKEYFENQIEIYGGVDNPVCRAQVFGEVIEDGLGCYVFNNTCWHTIQLPSTGYASMGVDCSGAGRDNNVFYVIDDSGILHKEKVCKADTFQMNSIARSLISRFNVKQVCIDITGGFGNGLYDFLKLVPGIDVQGINFGQEPDDVDDIKDKTGKKRHVHANARAQMYFRLAQRCRDGFFIDEQEVMRQLKAHTYFINSSGKSQLPEKDEIKAIIGCSPDSSDALALAMYKRGMLGTYIGGANDLYVPNRTY